MKRISLRFTILLATFLIGLGTAALWLLDRSNLVVDNTSKPHDCYPLYVDNFNASDYKGIITRRIYTINANNPTKRGYDEEINAEVTADIFRRFRETPLSIPAACVNESYRLTWIPTFHAPTVIRIWRSGEKYFIVTKRLNGKGGYGLGELEIEQTHALTAEEWQNFKSLISLASFWKMPSTIDESIPHDGATWTFEGFNDDKFHSVYRITPSAELKQLFRKLFELTGIEIEYERYL